jgi:peptide/bleomycin uptake transporter
LEEEMFKAFFWNRKQFLWAYGMGIILLTSLVLQVHMQVLINTWYGNFYDLLQNVQKHTVDEFYGKLGEFMVLALWLVVFAVNTYACSRFYSFAWRRAIFTNYLPLWAHTPKKLEGECQRLQEDAKRFAATVDALGLLVAKAAITLASFVPVLWALSKGVSVTVLEKIPNELLGLMCLVGVGGMLLWVLRKLFLRDRSLLYMIPEKSFLWIGVFGLWLYTLINGLTIGPDFGIPPLKFMNGSLVWIALFVTIGGMVVSWYVGYRLPGLEYDNQKAEATLRTELELAVQFNTKHELIPRFLTLFTGVQTNYYRLFRNYAYFDMWSTLFGQALVIVPYLIMGQSLFAGTITLGILMQVGNAFDKVQGSFSVFIDNWPTVNELRSIHKRLKEFQDNLAPAQLET